MRPVIAGRAMVDPLTQRLPPTCNINHPIGRPIEELRYSPTSAPHYAWVEVRVTPPPVPPRFECTVGSTCRGRYTALHCPDVSRQQPVECSASLASVLCPRVHPGSFISPWESPTGLVKRLQRPPTISGRNKWLPSRWLSIVNVPIKKHVISQKAGCSPPPSVWNWLSPFNIGEENGQL